MSVDNEKRELAKRIAKAVGQAKEHEAWLWKNSFKKDGIRFHEDAVLHSTLWAVAKFNHKNVFTSDEEDVVLQTLSRLSREQLAVREEDVSEVEKAISEGGWVGGGPGNSATRAEKLCFLTSRIDHFAAFMEPKVYRLLTGVKLAYEAGKEDKFRSYLSAKGKLEKFMPQFVVTSGLHPKLFHQSIEGAGSDVRGAEICLQNLKKVMEGCFALREALVINAEGKDPELPNRDIDSVAHYLWQIPAHRPPVYHPAIVMRDLTPHHNDRLGRLSPLRRSISTRIPLDRIFNTGQDH